MERFLVAGGARLAGEVTVTGAKNSVLKLMAAALLAALRARPGGERFALAVLSDTPTGEAAAREAAAAARLAVARPIPLDAPMMTIT